MSAGALRFPYGRVVVADPSSYSVRKRPNYQHGNIHVTKGIAGRVFWTVAVCGAILAVGLYLTGSVNGALWILGTSLVIGLMGVLYT